MVRSLDFARDDEKPSPGMMESPLGMMESLLGMMESPLGMMKDSPVMPSEAERSRGISITGRSRDNKRISQFLGWKYPRKL
ncbi:hypothetical protein G1C95_0844 [Bifidobacterium sp. DSM 109957]|uniref:Uncharacterized protein n=1 Tax=Bifidobacterium oedipodis TaxID=2675322 RepID=A0A7Y0ENQ0_9BIFI|nr:hypothetical protein [Bifidobacterium sp. DSM 109957]